MQYRYYYLLDLRTIHTAREIEQIETISDVLFLLYAAELSEELLRALRQKCRRVAFLLPMSENVPLFQILQTYRRM